MMILMRKFAPSKLPLCNNSRFVSNHLTDLVDQIDVTKPGKDNIPRTHSPSKLRRGLAKPTASSDNGGNGRRIVDIAKDIRRTGSLEAASDDIEEILSECLASKACEGVFGKRPLPITSSGRRRTWSRTSSSITSSRGPSSFTMVTRSGASDTASRQVSVDRMIEIEKAVMDPTGSVVHVTWRSQTLEDFMKLVLKRRGEEGLADVRRRAGLAITKKLQALEPRFRSALSQSRGFRKVPKLRFYMYPGPGKSREKGRTVQGLEDAGNVSMQPNSSESIRALSGVGDVLSMGEEDDDDAVAMPERMREFLVDSPAPIPFMHEIIVESSAPTQEDLPISR